MFVFYSFFFYSSRPEDGPRVVWAKDTVETFLYLYVLGRGENSVTACDDIPCRENDLEMISTVFVLFCLFSAILISNIVNYIIFGIRIS